MSNPPFSSLSLELLQTNSFSITAYPKFKKGLSDVDVKEGDTLKLTIQCQGVPEPEVKWYIVHLQLSKMGAYLTHIYNFEYLFIPRFKDGEEMYSDSRIKISRDAKRVENYHLTINLVRSEDGGEYEVRATNEIGTAVTRSLVTVLGKDNPSNTIFINTYLPVFLAMVL